MNLHHPAAVTLTGWNMIVPPYHEAFAAAFAQYASADESALLSAVQRALVDIIREAIGGAISGLSSSLYMRHEYLDQAQTNPRSLLGRWANA